MSDIFLSYKREDQPPIISLRGTPPPPRSGAAHALKQFAMKAEQATHFVQDLNQPLHAGWGETRAEHNEIEASMLYRSWQKDHGAGVADCLGSRVKEPLGNRSLC